MDNAELRKIIDQYVDDRYYDKDKLYSIFQCTKWWVQRFSIM